MSEVQGFDKFVLRKVPMLDAYYTSDIAYDCRDETTRVRRALARLEKAGLVERVLAGGKGLPASWRQTSEGREALRLP